MVIESERKKIDDLKDQVLVALNRLDKTGDIKIELKRRCGHKNSYRD